MTHPFAISTRRRGRRGGTPDARRHGDFAGRAGRRARRTGRAVTRWTGLLLAAAATAHADSIVFVKDDNVWVATPDGARSHAVTTDGTAADPYVSPSQARDGTIVALRKGSMRFHRLAQSGRPLAAPFEPGAVPAGDPDLSPDGSLIAYWFTTWCGNLRLCSRTLFSNADRWTAPEALDDGAGDLIKPSWIDDRHVVVANQANVYIDEVGPSEESLWFIEPGFTQVNDVDVAASGDRVALIGGTNFEYLQISTIAGPPPTVPEPACMLVAEPGEGSFSDPSWSPDGSALAFALRGGVYVMRGLRSMGDCSGLTGPLVFPGASDPDWGPADVGAQPTPSPTPTPAPTASPTPSATPQPTPQGDGRPPTLRVRLPRDHTMQTFRRQGLTVRVQGDEAIHGTVTVRFSRAVRRRCRLRPSYGRRYSISRAGAAEVRVRLPQRAARRVARLGSVRVMVRIEATDAAGDHAAVDRRVRLGRPAR